MSQNYTAASSSAIPVAPVRTWYRNRIRSFGFEVHHHHIENRNKESSQLRKMWDAFKADLSVMQRRASKLTRWLIKSRGSVMIVRLSTISIEMANFISFSSTRQGSRPSHCAARRWASQQTGASLSFQPPTTTKILKSLVVLHVPMEI